MSQSHIGGEEWKSMDSGVHLSSSGDQVIRQAKAGIEAHRKRDVELHVVDGKGKPVVGLEVQIIQKRHAFPFGDNLWHLDSLYRHGKAGLDHTKHFKHRFTEVFNAANALCYWTERPRNDAAKTEDFQGETLIQNFESCVDWAMASGLIVKGHPLFWSIPKAVPDWLGRYDYETQLKFLEVRIRNLVSRFQKKVLLWDAVNEALWEPAFKNLKNRDWPHIEDFKQMTEYIQLVLKWAREENPDACYVLNDYGLEADPPAKPVSKSGEAISAQYQRKRMLKLVELLGDIGAAPDAIGLQSHTGGWLDPESQVRLYDEMSQSGLPIHITEFWAKTEELIESKKYSQEDAYQLQAEYIANYLTCAFGHPAVEAFFFWGFMNSSIHWFDDRGYEPRPTFYRVRDLINKEWNTKTSGKTDSQGIFKFRGFYGDYSLRFATSRMTEKGIRFSVGKSQSMPLRVEI